MTKKKIISVFLVLVMSLFIVSCSANAAVPQQCVNDNNDSLCTYEVNGKTLTIHENNSVVKNINSKSNLEFMYSSRLSVYPFMDFSTNKYMPIYAIYESQSDSYIDDDIILALSQEVQSGKINKVIYHYANNDAMEENNGPITSTFKLGKDTITINKSIIVKLDHSKRVVQIYDNSDPESPKYLSFLYENGKLKSMSTDYGETPFEYTIDNGNITKAGYYFHASTDGYVVTCNYTSSGILNSTKFECFYNEISTKGKGAVNIQYFPGNNGQLQKVSCNGSYKEDDYDFQTGKHTGTVHESTNQVLHFNF